MRDARQEFAKREATFEAGEGGTEAEVDAVAEGDVAVSLRPRIESIGIRKYFCIPVGRTDDGDDERAYRLAGAK